MNATTPQRGDIYFIRKGKGSPTGVEMHAGRPALIVSNNTMNATAGFVHVVFLRRNIASNGPIHVDLGHCIDASRSVAACEQVTVVDQSRIGDYITHIDDEIMTHINDALTYSLGLPSAA